MILHLIPLGYAFLAGSSLGAVLCGLIVARPLRNALHREQELRRAAVERGVDHQQEAQLERQAKASAIKHLEAYIDHLQHDRDAVRAERDVAKIDLQQLIDVARVEAVAKYAALDERDALSAELARWKHPRMPNGRWMPREATETGAGGVLGVSDVIPDPESRSGHVQARLNEV